MPPGSTSIPLASISRAPAPPVRFRPISAIVPLRRRTSPSVRPTAVTIRPLRTISSAGCCAAARATNATTRPRKIDRRAAGMIIFIVGSFFRFSYVDAGLSSSAIPPVNRQTGAVIRRRFLGRVRGFPLRARVGVTAIPFPVPAASHAACGFTALRAPAPLRVKGYGAVRVGKGGRASVSRQRGTLRRVRASRTTTRYSTASSRNRDSGWPAPHGAESSSRPYLEVEDVDALHSRLTKKGVAISDPLTLQWWGDRTFKILDPNGYEIWFYTNVAEPKPPQGAKLV
ncbi:MAG: hypothetical protein DMF95_04385 [Acidobacteria bacterium]|nr:MAG: hypothetical protein DMF96_17680 [Acidobacteriota bacterium]PYR53367.1 MAG: hypothetical protein DMF95_04385 [Acidobacteriota bacterium]